MHIPQCHGKMYRQYYNDEMDPEEEASFRTHVSEG